MSTDVFSTCLTAALMGVSTLAQATAPAQRAAVAEPGAEAAVASSTDKQHWSDLDAILRNAAGHPNEIWRLRGADAAARGAWDRAFDLFQRAARYADKYSQHRISLMYWHGVGVPRDRALGYAWADLAGERLYPQFVLLREKMWMQMDAAERTRAIAQGQAIYAEFGDAVAKQRFAVALGQVKRQITGSHTGSTTGPLVVSAPGVGGGLGGYGGPDVSKMYAANRWDIESYWKTEDVLWTNGNVDVGPLERVDGTPPPAPASGG